ncbi:hypothetical protein PFISCL1PPCAC_20940, partial [Pristionchus fissidentatus]
IQSALKRAESYLIGTTQFERTEKLQLADQYNLNELRDNNVLFSSEIKVPDFSAPDRLSNVILVVEGKKLHLSREGASMRAEKYLISTTKFERVAKLQFADEFRLNMLRV